MVLPMTMIGRRSVGSPVLHRLQRADDLVVVVAVRHRHDVPAVRRPLLDEVVAVILAVDDAADERVVDAGVVLGEHDAQPLAHLQRQRLRLQLLRVTGAERELAFERDDLRLVDRRADHVPERGLAGGQRQPDARRAAVDVVALIDRFDVARTARGCRARLPWPRRTAGRRPARCPGAASSATPAPRRKPSASIARKPSFGAT